MELLLGHVAVLGPFPGSVKPLLKRFSGCPPVVTSVTPPTSCFLVMKKLLATLVLLTPFALNCVAVEGPAKPNILFILADDTGIDDYGCYGSDRFKGRTPNIDSLAKSGLRFERCYSEPLCGPSRCTIMTGRYVFRSGGISNPTAHTPSFRSEPSLATTLKRAGYATGMAGKWRQMSDSPGDWGFDEFITDNTAGGWYWKSNYNENGKWTAKGSNAYGPDVCMEFTKEFLRRHKNEPFYFYFPTHLVHGPIVRTPDSRSGRTGQAARGCVDRRGAPAPAAVTPLSPTRSTS